MEKNELVYNNASYLYNKLLNDYEHLDGEKKKKKHNKHIFKDLFLEGNNYNKCFEFNFKQTINHTSNIVSTNKS